MCGLWRGFKFLVRGPQNWPLSQFDPNFCWKLYRLWSCQLVRTHGSEIGDSYLKSPLAQWVLDVKSSGATQFRSRRVLGCSDPSVVNCNSSSGYHLTFMSYLLYCIAEKVGLTHQKWHPVRQERVRRSHGRQEAEGVICEGELHVHLDDVINSGSWLECHSNWLAELTVWNFCILNWLDITSMTKLIKYVPEAFLSLRVLEWGLQVSLLWFINSDPCIMGLQMFEPWSS